VLMLAFDDGPVKAGPRVRQCPLWVDTVEKVCFSERTKFSRGTGASIRKLYRGTHSQTDFQPAAFVSSL
jgi:hypothetical protein